jgi:cobalt-zinc-cadmium resistance protein CzcA
VGDTDHPSGILIAEVAETAPETRRPLLFGQLIIMTVCLPLRAVSGIEAKMPHPMGIMVVMTIVATIISSVNFLPAAIARFINKEVAEHDNKLIDKGRISTGTFQNGSCTTGRSG